MNSKWLEQSLKGKPVKLRNGWKAYVRHKEVELNSEFCLIGYCFHVSDDGNITIVPIFWNLRGWGKHFHFDIIGLWEE